MVEREIRGILEEFRKSLKAVHDQDVAGMASYMLDGLDPDPDAEDERKAREEIGEAVPADIDRQVDHFRKILTRYRERCCICGAELFIDNNPDPVKSVYSGRCCEICNDYFVLPARRAELTHEEAEKMVDAAFLDKDIPDAGDLERWIEKKVDVYQHVCEHDIMNRFTTEAEAADIIERWKSDLESQVHAFLEATNQ